MRHLAGDDRHCLLSTGIDRSRGNSLECRGGLRHRCGGGRGFRTSHWSIVKDRLEFHGATGKLLAVFEKRPAEAGKAAVLDGTTWQLVKFQGGDDRVLTPDDPSKYTIAFAAGGQVAARTDCNRGRGTWKATASGQLELGPLALTRALCAKGSLHDQIAKQWTNVRSFVIRNGHLFLALMADGGIYEFAPVGGEK